MRKILVVDDEPDILDLLRDSFMSSDLEVFTAGNEEEFQNQIQSHNFDIIILDIVLGDQDGTELYNRFIREEGLDPKIPVIFLSALAGDTASTIPRQGKVYILMAKPFEPERLVDQVNRLLAA